MMIQNNGEFFRSEWSRFTVLVPSLIEVNVRWVVCHGFVEVGILGNDHQPIRRARVHTGRVCTNVSPRDPARQETVPPARCARSRPLPPCFHTQFTSSQTTEAHFTEVASIEDEPEAVEVGRGVVKTRFNQECGAPLFQYLDVRM